MRHVLRRGTYRSYVNGSCHLTHAAEWHCFCAAQTRTALVIAGIEKRHPYAATSATRSPLPEELEMVSMATALDQPCPVVHAERVLVAGRLSFTRAAILKSEYPGRRLSWRVLSSRHEQYQPNSTVNRRPAEAGPSGRIRRFQPLKFARTCRSDAASSAFPHRTPKLNACSLRRGRIVPLW